MGCHENAPVVALANQMNGNSREGSGGLNQYAVRGSGEEFRSGKMDSLRLKLTLHDKIREQAHIEVVRSSGLKSTLVYPLLVAFLALAGNLFARSPTAEIAACAVVASLGTGVLRFYVGQRVLQGEAKSPQQYPIYQGLIVLTAAIWAMYACAVAYYCRDTTTGFLAVLSSLAIVAGSTWTLTPDLKLLRIYIATMVIPPGLVISLQGGRAEGVTALMLLVFTAFVWSTGKVHHERFLSWLRYNLLLDLRTHQLQESRRQAAESLEQETRARQEAEVANQSKSDFLAAMSHEIRTPMNAIVTLADLLNETPLNEVQQDWVETIKNGCDSLLALISDVLDMAKIESGHLDLQCSPFSPTELCQELARLLHATARQKGLELALEAETVEPVMGDRYRLRQVLLNLLGNAIKFTPAGFVRLTMRRVAEFIDFTVIDSGVGLSEPDRLFKPFSQLDPSSTREFGGTGLGLAISHRLVDFMGGWLWAESRGHIVGTPPPGWLPDKSEQPASGSAFHFRIPAPISTPVTESGMLALASEPALLAVMDSLTILVVEDNQVNQKVLRHLLQKLGHKFDLAEDGLAALESLRQHAYDVILMDLQMPRLDGIQTTQRIRSQDLPRQPWIIAVTANAFEEDRTRCMAAGMNDFLTKPLRHQALSRALQRIPAT